MASRRSLLRRLSGLASVVGLAGCTGRSASTDRKIDPDLPENRADVPVRQHALNEFVRTDDAGNPLTPRHHRVLLLRLRGPPSRDAARTVERAMRTLDAAYDWSSSGLFHALAWGTRYFERSDALDRAPIAEPRVLSRTDDPDLLSFDAALVLSGDVPSHLAAAEAAMFGDRDSVGGESIGHRLGDIFERVGRRTGFIGDGLPVRHLSAEGVPKDAPLTERDRMFMGFKSGYRGTQATEDRVTVPDGPFANGTTMHLSHLRHSLGDWFDRLDETDRVAQMFSPEFTPDGVAEFTDDVPFSDAVREHASEFGVVGHQEKVARVRENGRPVILRRDFNTVDGGQAGVHFLSLQQSLKDFRRTRKAMNGWYLRDDHPAVREQQNNGILEFITVVSRANFYVPPREMRAFPPV